MKKPRFPLQRQPGDPCGIALSWQGRTGRQALEVGQHTERRAGVDAQSGSTEHRHVTGHLEQHLLREHPPRPPHPWAQQHRGHSHGGGKQRKTISSHRSLSASNGATPGTSCTPERESWNVCPCGYSQNTPRGKERIPRCLPRFITQQSLIISQRDNGTGAPWACVQR